MFFILLFLIYKKKFKFQYYNKASHKDYILFK